MAAAVAIATVAIATGDPTVDPDATGDDGDPSDDPGAAKTAVPAAERRRAAGIIVGLWRDVARDLLVVALGEERLVHDIALLDDLREASAHLDPATGGQAGSEALGAFLGRLDAAGELLEANVRPELVLDTLLLHWPTAAAR